MNSNLNALALHVSVILLDTEPPPKVDVAPARHRVGHIGSVRLGSVTIQSQHPEQLRQVADALTEAAALLVSAQFTGECAVVRESGPQAVSA